MNLSKIPENSINDGNYLKAAFDGITDLILVMDKDLTILFGNKAVKDFFIVDDYEIIGKKCYEVLHKHEDYCEDCPAIKTKESNKITIIEKYIKGEILKYWTYPIFNDKNELVNIVSYGRNITNQKQIEYRLIQSEKLTGIGRLAAGVAHELNNPLTSILGFAELISESFNRDSSLNEYLTEIIESAKQGKKIVMDLLEYARQSVSKFDSYNIGEVINKTISLVSHTLKIKKIKVVTDSEDNLPNVVIDIQKTMQVFLNIITNAIDACPNGGELFIKTKKESKGYVLISFHDTGVGIRQEDLNKIFDPFFTTKSIGKGTGLGLSICLGIIEQQRGKIKVESDSGKGTTVKISLPVEH